MSVYYSGITVSKYFRALNLHFRTDDYDFVKYKGKLCGNKTYNKSDDKLFQQFSGMIEAREVVPFFVSQFVGRIGNFSISDIMKKQKKSQDIYENWLDRISDLDTLFKTDLRKISRFADGSWRFVLNSSHVGDYPPLFKMVVQGEISPETYSLLNDVFSQTIPRDFLGNDLMYVMMNRKYRKYRSFLNMSTERVISITPGNLSVLNNDVD